MKVNGLGSRGGGDAVEKEPTARVDVTAAATRETEGRSLDDDTAAAVEKQRGPRRHAAAAAAGLRRPPAPTRRYHCHHHSLPPSPRTTETEVGTAVVLFRVYEASDCVAVVRSIRRRSLGGGGRTILRPVVLIIMVVTSINKSSTACRQ